MSDPNPRPDYTTDLLADLDAIAREECHFEYGLPLYSEDAVQRMRQAVGAYRLLMTAAAVAEAA